MSWARQVTLSEAIAISEAAVDDVENLVRQHARFVFQVAYSVLRNREDAEDAVQETFLRLTRKKDDLRQIEDPRLWLARVAWRCAVDRVRKRPEQPLDEALVSTLADASSAADERILEGQVKALLEQMVAALPRDLRDVVRLSTVEEMSGAGIAALLDIPEASVRTRLFRARQILREKMLAAIHPSPRESRPQSARDPFQPRAGDPGEKKP